MSNFNGNAGNSGMPGAPIMHFSLHSNGNVILPSPFSTVNITQAIAPPLGNRHIQITGGHVVILPMFPASYHITIHGFDHTVNWFVSVPFTATLILHRSPLAIFPPHLYGTASWTLGNQHINNVPVSATLNP